MNASDLKRFATEVLGACKQTPAAGRFGRKTWINACWAIGQFEMSLDAFKANLWLAAHAGHLQLARADLVEALDPRDVRRSRLVVAGGFEFHFIRG